MAYLSTYIRQILSSREPVVLPGFGSLVIIEGKGGRGAAGKIDPPGQTLQFDPTHPKGDGKLAGVYAAGENIDPEEARQQVLELVDAIKFKLDKGERYKLEEVGIFSRDDDNRIHFTKDPGWVIDPETFGLDSLEILELEDEEAEELSGKSEPAGKSGAPAGTEPGGKTLRSPGRKTGPVTSGAKKPSRAIQRKPVNKWKIIWIVVGALIAVLVLVLLIPSGNGVEFGKEGILIKEMNGERETPSSDRSTGRSGKDRTTEDRAVADQSAEEEAAAEAPRDEPPVQQNKYFIIAGSFQSLQNATTLLNKLEASGFPAEMIVTENRMYRVSIQSYANRDEAIRELPRIKAESGIESAWVMTR